MKLLQNKRRTGLKTIKWLFQLYIQDLNSFLYMKTYTSATFVNFKAYKSYKAFNS